MSIDEHVRSKFSISCRAFHPLHRNTLRGFAEIHIEELRLTIRDVALHEKGTARWAQLPAKPQIRDGELVRDEADKIQYVHLMDFDSRAVRDAFSAAVIRAVLEFAPAAFEDEAV
jgi:hypothetical protein